MLKMYCKVLLAALLSEGRVDHSALNDNLVLPGVKARPSAAKTLSMSEIKKINRRSVNS